MDDRCSSASLDPFGVDASAARFFLRHNRNNRPASRRNTSETAILIPAFASVERPLWVSGELLVLGEGWVVVVEVTKVYDSDARRDDSAAAKGL